MMGIERVRKEDFFERDEGRGSTPYKFWALHENV